MRTDLFDFELPAASIALLPTQARQAERVNVQGTRNIVELCREHGVRRLVYFSSLEAFCTDPLDRPVDEARPLVGDEFQFAYTRTKAAATRIVQQAVVDGLDAVILYPAATTRGRQDREVRSSGVISRLQSRSRYAAPHPAARRSRR